jgi:hypothetical protein
MLYPPYPSEATVAYGFIRRARGCYLYTQSGKRLTDLYQEAGRAILGWEGGNARTVFKNVLNRGASGSFESEESHRLEKAVGKLLPDFPVVRWYTGETAKALFAETLGQGNAPDRRYTLWRPWVHACSAWQGEPIITPEVLLLPPFPWGDSCVIRAAKTESPDAPSSPLLPPCLLAAITRSIYDLIQELPRRNEKGWNRWDGVFKDFWTRRGPYLFPKIPREDYADFARRCLGQGLVISPLFELPSIIPWEANEGDISGRELWDNRRCCCSG